MDDPKNIRLFVLSFAFVLLFALVSAEVELDPPSLQGSISTSKQLSSKIAIVNNTEDYLEVYGVEIPRWIVLEQPDITSISPQDSLVFSFDINLSTIPKGRVEENIKFNTSNGVILFPIKLFVDYNYALDPTKKRIIFELSYSPDSNNLLKIEEPIQTLETCEEAYAMNLHTWYRTKIDYNGDIDWFKWFPDRVADYWIILDVPEGEDYDLQIFTSCSSIFGFVCNEIGDEWSCIYTPSASQYYYIKVYDYEEPHSSDYYYLKVTYNCSDECTYGERQCNGSYSQTCGDYDSDSCYEWPSSTSGSGNEYCSYGCNTSTGTCNSTPSCPSYCSGDTLNYNGYWNGSSCSYNTQNCNNSDGYVCSSDTSQYRDYYCSTSALACSYSVSSSLNCNDNDYFGSWEYYCSGNDLRKNHKFFDYGCIASSTRCQFNSSNYVDDQLVESCRYACVGSSPNSQCDSGCSGRINVAVEDKFGSRMQNASVYKNGSFYGYTNSQGIVQVDTLSGSCGETFSIKVVASDGTDCGTKTTIINEESDNDYIYFSCNVSGKSLEAFAVSNKSSYSVSDQVNFQINVFDSLASPISNAAVGISDPLLYLTTSRTTDSSGIASYYSLAERIGSFIFFFSAYSSGFEPFYFFKNITVKDSDQIIVSTKYSDGSALKDAKIYLDEQFKGSTDSSGTLTLSTSKGNHTVAAKCPDNKLYCGAQNVSVEGSKSVSFSCNCVKDSDGDGFSDEDEEIVGTDPYNSSENLDTILYSNKITPSCLNPFSILTGFFSKSEKDSIIKSYERAPKIKGNEIMTSNTFPIQYWVREAGIKAEQLQEPISLKDAFEDSAKIERVEKGSELLLVVSGKNGKISIFGLGALCAGTYVGTPVGAYNGLSDDVEFGIAVLNGIVYYSEHLFELTDALVNGVSMLLDALSALIGGGVDFDELGYGITMDIMVKGNEFNFVSDFGREEKLYFQIGFFQGYVLGYLGEQIATIYISVEKILSAFRAIDVAVSAGRLTELAAKATSSIARLTEKFGYSTAKLLRTFSIGERALETWDDVSQNGLARLLKYFGKTDDVDSFLKNLSESEQLALASRIDNVAVKLETELGEEAAESAMAKVVKSDYGFTVFKEWEEDSQKGIAKFAYYNDVSISDRLITKYGSDVSSISFKGIERNVIINDPERIEKLAQYTEKFGGDSLENIGEEQLMILSYRNEINLLVKNEVLNSASALKKGTSSWGWEHIVAQNHHIQIKDALNLVDDDISVKKVINEVVETGEIKNYVPNDYFEVIKNVQGNGKTHSITVIISDRADKKGWIISAYPE